uniref:HEAT repeat-containing protein 6 n=1 Tax=Bracon brevicornis TaxID=1563983 RepID=A0A6V7IXR0_9HYME
MLTCRKWLHQALEFSEAPAKNTALIALKNLIETSPFTSTSEDFEILIGDEGIFHKLILSDAEEIKNSVINCLEAILTTRERDEGVLLIKYRNKIRDLALSILKSPPTVDPSLWSVKTICSCLKILPSVMADADSEQSPESNGEILGIVQTYLLFGINDIPIVKPTILRPAVMDLPGRVHVPPKGRGTRPITKAKARRACRKNDKEKKIDGDSVTFGKSSDSEVSDSERCSQSHFFAKIRVEALKLLNEIMKTISSNELFGYWSQIITNPGPELNSRVLLRLILIEPTSKIRQIALGILTDAIIDARMFLIHAEESDHPSFITIFGTVGAMLREIHSSLSLLLSSEKNPIGITQALKCSASLVQVTPYGRLKKGLATKLARHCRCFLLHEDPTVKVVAISVFEAFCAVENFTPEIMGILHKKSRDTNLFKRLKKTALPSGIAEPSVLGTMNTEFEETEEEIDSSDLETSTTDNEVIEEPEKKEKQDNSSFLVQLCLNNIGDMNVNVPVRLQSFKLLGALINSIDENLCNYFDVHIITQHLVNASRESEPQISLHACRVIEIISTKLSCCGSKEENILMNFWNNIFGAILSVSQRTEGIVREVACDCFGTITNGIFTQLSHDKTIIIKTTLFGACRDDESGVRAAGLRSLGMLINLPLLEEDTGFVEDVAEVVCNSLRDDNLGVRVKGAWALANLCDCLIKQDKNEEIEPLPLEIILPNLYKASVKAAKDNNKVKCNALRAVGNVLYLSHRRKVLGDVSEAIDVLIASATHGNDMKVRWNACRALGLAISQEPDEIFPQNWTDKIIPPLCDLICHSSNFKVRTNAAWALASCKSYGKYVPFLWKSIVIALENSQHVPNFVEYTHRESLVQQLCLTLGHVAARTDPSDLQILWPDIKDHVDEIEVHMKHFQERVLPEKTDDFVRAKLILKNYAQTMSLHSNERFIADVLGNLFESKNFYDELENTVLVN